MKRIANSILLRASISLALCASFIIYPLQHLSTARAEATAHAVADLKSESQYRSEASRYDAAIRAIGTIATMKLDTADDLKKAIEILNRERANLKFHRSKLIALALSDPIFTSAVKKKAPDNQAAEAFAKELNANRQAIFKLDGAESLKTRMRRNDESDAARLRRAGERLKEAADKLKKAGQGGAARRLEANGEDKSITASFKAAEQPSTHDFLTRRENVHRGGQMLAMQYNHPVTRAPQKTFSREDDWTEDHTIALAVSAAVLIVIFVGAALITNIVTEEGRDAVAACFERNDARFERCLDEAAAQYPGGIFNPFYVTAIAFCESDWLVRAAACLLAS